MFYNRFNAVEDKLTSTERRIAHFIRSQPEAAQSMTSYEMSAALGIGQSTIIRFSKKLGYNSFRDLQVSVAKSGADTKDIQDVSLSEDTSTTNRKITVQYQDIISLTNSINSVDEIERAIALIRSSERMMTFGVGNSNLFAEYFANQLIKIGFGVYCTSNAHLAYSTAAGYTERDVVILVSESGETREVLKLAAIAKSRGARVISMTRMIKNSLYEHSDVILKTVNNLSKTRLEAMTMRCSQLCLIDMIYLNLFKTNYEHYYKIVEQAEMLRDVSV